MYMGRCVCGETTRTAYGSDGPSPPCAAVSSYWAPDLLHRPPRKPNQSASRENMGCAASAPKAETFLANEQPAPKNGYMVDGVPTEGVTMQAWSNFDAGNRYHAQSGLGGALQVASMVIAQDEQGSHFDGSTLGDAVGNAGVGSSETLPITALGAQIATLSMPPHMCLLCQTRNPPVPRNPPFAKPVGPLASPACSATLRDK